MSRTLHLRHDHYSGTSMKVPIVKWGFFVKLLHCIISFFVEPVNKLARDQLGIFNRLIEKWAEHDEPLIILSPYLCERYKQTSLFQVFACAMQNYYPGKIRNARIVTLWLYRNGTPSLTFSQGGFREGVQGARASPSLFFLELRTSKTFRNKQYKQNLSNMHPLRSLSRKQLILNCKKDRLLTIWEPLKDTDEKFLRKCRTTASRLK